MLLHSWFKFIFARIKITFHSTKAIIRLCSAHSFSSFSILVGVRLCLFVIHFFPKFNCPISNFQIIAYVVCSSISIFPFCFVYNLSCWILFFNSQSVWKPSRSLMLKKLRTVRFNIHLNWVINSIIISFCAYSINDCVRISVSYSEQNIESKTIETKIE